MLILNTTVNLDPKGKGGKLIQKHKFEFKARITQISIGVSSKNDWVIHSGCSNHMTGEESFLVEVKPFSKGYVTFRDSKRGRIKGIGNMVIPLLPCLNEVLVIEGLTTNLISISQICDQGFKVSSNKDECVATNKEHKEMIKGSRSKDNFYV